MPKLYQATMNQQIMENSTNNIILVDDSENLRSVIKEYLEIKGYSVWDFKDSESAAKSVFSQPFDLCIIDLNMRGNDSFALLQYIRKYDKRIPVVILSDTDSKEERIRGFKLGCDDYVTKPFSIEELELRVHAILNRSKYGVVADVKIIEEKIYKMGNFVFNFSDMQLIHPKITRTLTRKEAELLKLLCDHKNKLIPREIILREVWGDEDHSAGRSMDVFLTKLRSYLQVDDEGHLAPKKKGTRKVTYLGGYEPAVEICNVHGTGFMLKIKE